MKVYEECSGSETTIVETTNNWVFLTVSNASGRDTVTLTRDEAIAAARAILAHYKEPV